MESGLLLKVKSSSRISKDYLYRIYVHSFISIVQRSFSHFQGSTKRKTKGTYFISFFFFFDQLHKWFIERKLQVASFTLLTQKSQFTTYPIYWLLIISNKKKWHITLKDQRNSPMNNQYLITSIIYIKEYMLWKKSQ